MKKVSFVMPVRNGEKFVEATVDSLLNQTYENIEVVIVNDHSDDNTMGVIQNIAEHTTKVKVYDLKEKTGVGAGRNLGTKHTSGEIIMPVDSDDPSFPERAELSVLELEKSRSDIFYANVERFFIDSGKRELRHFQPYDEKMFRSINYIAHGASAFNRKVWDAIGSYDENIKIGEDYDFFLSAQEKGFKFCSKNVAVAQYTMHTGQVTSSIDPDKIRQRQEWNKLVRAKHKIYKVDQDYIRNNGTPSIVDFYINKNWDIWFSPESVPRK